MAAEDVLAFLEAVDAELSRHAEPGEMLDLHLLGRSALILKYEPRLMTKDVDVVDEGSRLLAIAIRVFARGGAEHRTRGFYLEAVSSGLPPLPAGYKQRCADIPGPWRVIRPKRLEPHDLVVSKLRRFHAGDREDIQILCDTGDIDEVTLRQRFEQAHLFSDRDDPPVVRSQANLEAVVEYLGGQRQSL